MSGRDSAHRLVWLDRADALEEHLSSEDGRESIGQLDVRGNTPLHLALMLGRKDCVKVLLKYDAPLMTRNDLGWFPLHEARALGDREMILAVLATRRAQHATYIAARARQLITKLKELDDFYLEMQWDFSSWIPLVSRFCPSDTYKLWKRGAFVRVDTTLVGFENLRWVRGKISFIFRVTDDESSGELYMVDHGKKQYEIVRQVEDERKAEERTNFLMNMAIRTGELQADKLTFQRSKGGFMGMGSVRSERVGEFESDVYQLANLRVVSKARNEHLDVKVQTDEVAAPTAQPTDADMSQLLAQAEQTVPESEARLQLIKRFDEKKDSDVDKYYHSAKQKALRYRSSLIPPPATQVTFQGYFFPELADPPQSPLPNGRFAPLHVGRPMQLTETARNLKAVIWMSTSFPMFIEQLMPLLEIMAPSNEHFARLKEFVELKLPRGFPVQLELPLFGLLTAKVTFQNYRNDTEIDPALFVIDPEYTEGEVSFHSD